MIKLDAGGDYFLIPVIFVKWILKFIAILGINFGAFSFLMPGLIIRFYQWAMEKATWKAEPIYPDRELRNTRWLGLVTMLLSFLIIYFQQRI